MLKGKEGTHLNRTVVKCVTIFAVVLATYWNHFDNGFHFDDFTAIVNNIYIRNLQNIPSFFTDLETYSTFPANQIYRPIVTTSVAIDYWLGGGLNPVFFHLSMFLTFLLQGLFMFFIFRRISTMNIDAPSSSVLSMLIVTWYLLHPVNAETLNYILARSDLLSTFFVVLSLFLFAKGGSYRKFFIYLIPLALGLLTKRTAAMFLPILFCYVLLFETEYPIYKAHFLLLHKKHRQLLLHFLAVFGVSAAAYYIAEANTVVSYPITFNSDYLITQPYVLMHYFKMLFLPLELSADTDWKAFTSLSDPRVIQGFLFLIGLILFSLYCSTVHKLKPISFGILWFLFALVPTSSFIPLTEVMNDHRMYFPFVGLVLAVGWGIYVIYAYLLKNSKHPHLFTKWSILVYMLLMTLYAYGTYERNKVWDNSESLWKDVVVKSPKNGRGLMNYGVVLMKNGKVDEALSYFTEALQYVPNYSYLHTNIAIALEYNGKFQEAEPYFLKALTLLPQTPASNLYYAKFLNARQRQEEAVPILKAALTLAPGDINTRHLLMELYSNMGATQALDSLAKETLTIAPKDEMSIYYLQNITKESSVEKIQDIEYAQFSADQLLTLSLNAFNRGEYAACIAFCQHILKVDTTNAAAYNNLCSAYTQLEEFDAAEQACLQALAIEPDYELAKNNLLYLRSLRE